MSSNRLWEVRECTDGRGPVLIHVYADTMEAARDAALRNLPQAEHYLAYPEFFTVHALTGWKPDADTVTLAAEGLPPAPDFEEIAVAA